MAGSSQQESFGNRNLWQFISGTGVLRPKELIARELSRHKDKILSGLLHYKAPSAPQGEQLKNKNLSQQQKDFVQRLSIFLALEESTSYELFCTYLSQDFRGSQKNLQLSFSSERHANALIFKIRDFYYSERLYLLQCIKHVVSYWPDADHPYKEEYAQFLNSMLEDNCLIKKLLTQLELLFDAKLPSWETHSSLMNGRQQIIWAHQNMREQQEILEILLVYWKDFEVEVEDFIKILEKFKSQGFGKRQGYKHILDESMNRFLKRIGALEVLVLLQGLDMENTVLYSQAGDFSEHSILKDKASFKKVDGIIQLLGSDDPHGPLLLAWAVIRQFYLGTEGTAVTRKMGNMALQLNVFQFLSDLLSREPFSGKSMPALLSHYVVYYLLYAALTAYDEETLGRNTRDLQLLYHVASLLLKKEFVAEDVWRKGLDNGLGTLFQSALLAFPLDFSRLVKLSTSWASASSDSAGKVLDVWSELPRYTEYLDRNSSQDLMPTQDSSIFKLVRDKMPYVSDDFRISVGVEGQIISLGRKTVSDIESPIIQWDVTYHGLQLMKCEVQELLHLVSRGAGMVHHSQIAKVTDISEFIKVVLTSMPQAVDGLLDIISLLYKVIQRFTSFNPPPLDLLGASIDCATCVAKQHPGKTWHNVKQTGLLPFLTENVDNLAEVLSGAGLSPGLYGALLAGFEIPQGHYPLTTAFLSFLSEMILPMLTTGQEDQLMPSVMYVLREIFPVFQKWRYYHGVKKETIGQKCLEILHKILNFNRVKKKDPSNRPHLQEICVYSLLFTESGRSLLEIASTGVETVEMLLAQHGGESESTGDDLVQLIQLAFSVLNRLLLLRSPDLPMSPVEGALSSQPAGYQNQHIVAVIAEYIYHRNNPRLPTLATLFVKRLAYVLPMSILACLGNQAEPIRDIYLMRLNSATEDLRLKTGILELLSACVDTQPGLIEVFLNIQSDQAADQKDLAMGKISCLQTVLELMNVKKQETYLCPADLLCACTKFMQALWAGMRETAMSVLRSREHFWPSLCAPLFRDLPCIGDDDDTEMLPHQMRTVAYILKILAQEIYSVTSAKLDDRLKKALKDIAAKGRMKYWSSYIAGAVKAEAEIEERTPEQIADSPTLNLLIAWKNLLVVLAKFEVPELQLGDGLKEFIMVDLLESIHAQLAGTMNQLSYKLGQNCSALFFTLVKKWTSCISVWQQIVKQVHDAIAESITRKDITMPAIQVGLLGSMTALLQHVRQETSVSIGIQNLKPVLSTVCELQLQCTRELPSPKALKDTQESQEKTTAASFTNTDLTLKLQIVACSLVEELIQHTKDVDVWLPVVQENMILPALLTSAETYLKSQVGLQYLQNMFLMFLAVAKSEKGAESLAVAGLTHHTCLAITFCYMDSNGTVFVPSQSRNKKSPVDQVTWHSLYCLCIELYSVMLRTLRYSFLEDALNFVGGHQERMHQSLDMARRGLYEEAFHEAEKTCSFVCQLSHYSKEWRLHLPDALTNILTSMMYMCQSFVSYMIRPKYLQYMLEHHSSERGQSKTSLPPSLQHQTSTEDIENPTAQLIQFQHTMLKIVSLSVDALRRFSPDLCEILVDQNMDIAKFQPFLAVGFSTPPVDQDTPPTFGTMLTTVNVCMRILTKIEPRSTSPHRSSDTSLPQQIPKSLVVFVLEHSLYLIMSQAMLYLKDPQVAPRDKQLLKRELGTEMNFFLSGIHRYLRRGGPSSPGSSTLAPSPRSQTQSPGGTPLSRSISQTFTTNQDQAIFRLVQEFTTQVLR